MNQLPELREQLAIALKSPLPGDVEQLKMAPYNRNARDIAKKVNPNPRLSAVLLLLFPRKNKTHFALIQRPAYKGVHSAQVSLPGGKLEPSDVNLEYTALRETQEELGVPITDVEVLGELTPVYIPPSGFLVTPFVGVSQQEPTFTPEMREVEYVLESPISRLTEADVIKSKKIQMGLSGLKVETPFFDIQNHVVWGATAMILSEFKAILMQS